MLPEEESGGVTSWRKSQTQDTALMPDCLPLASHKDLLSPKLQGHLILLRPFSFLPFEKCYHSPASLPRARDKAKKSQELRSRKGRRENRTVPTPHSATQHSLSAGTSFQGLLALTFIWFIWYQATDNSCGA